MDQHFLCDRYNPISAWEISLISSRKRAEFLMERAGMPILAV